MFSDFTNHPKIFLFRYFLIRQYIAVAVICIAYGFLLDEKYKKFVGLCIIATLFHRSALIMLPLAYIYKKCKNRKIYYIFSAMIILGSISCVYGFEFLISFIPKYQALYVESNYGQARSLSAFFFLGVIALGYLLCANFKVEYFKQRFDRVRDFNNMLILAYGLIWILSYKVFILHRIAPYFEIMLCFSIPYVIEKQKRYRYLTYFILINLLFVYYYIFLSKNLAEVVPYVVRI